VAQNRFRDPIHHLKKVLDTGLIGKVVHAQIDSLWNRGHSYYDLWWRGTWEKEGGGCTLNHAVHHIDMLGWMLGAPEQVSAMISNANHDTQRSRIFPCPCSDTAKRARQVPVRWRRLPRR
jgi:predicted dehydrogenase